MGTENTYLDERKNDIIKALAAYNEALKKNDAADIRRTAAALKDAEGEYAKQMAADVYAECREQPQPILYAVKKYTYKVIGHTEEKEDGVVLSAEINEEKIRTIDLFKLCTTQGLDTRWALVAQDHNLSLLLDMCKSLGLNDRQIAEVDGSMAMDKKARALHEAKADKSKRDPTSKTAMLADLQAAVDAVFIGDKVAPGTFKCNNHDVEYFRRLYGRKGKKSLAVAASNHAYYRRILMDVLHRIVCNLKYGVEFDMIDKDGNRAAGCIYAEEIDKPKEKKEA